MNSLALPEKNRRLSIFDKLRFIHIFTSPFFKDELRQTNYL
jgi:hypothetical protein